MARLYSRVGAAAIDDPEFGHFEADPEHGGFDLPDDLSERMHRFRRGQRWETATERDLRQHRTEEARQSDPKELYAAVSKIAGVAEQLAALRLDDATAAAEAKPAPEPVKAAPAKTAAAK